MVRDAEGIFPTARLSELFAKFAETLRFFTFYFLLIKSIIHQLIIARKNANYPPRHHHFFFSSKL